MTNRPTIRLAVAMAALVLSAVAAAQTPPAAPAAPAKAGLPTVTVPPVASHACSKPEFPGRVSPEARLRKWSTDFLEYIDCLKRYVAERNATIEANNKGAKAAVDEFNASVTEYNETVKSLN